MNTTLLVGEILVIKKPYDHDYMHIFTALALFSIKSMTDASRPRTLKTIFIKLQKKDKFKTCTKLPSPSILRLTLFTSQLS